MHRAMSTEADSAYGSRPPLLCLYQAEEGIRDADVTGVQTCALPISPACAFAAPAFASSPTWAAGSEMKRKLARRMRRPEAMRCCGQAVSVTEAPLLQLPNW